MPLRQLRSLMRKVGGTHDRKTQEVIRLMAVVRMLGGDEVTAIMASYGLCRATRYKIRSPDVNRQVTLTDSALHRGLSSAAC